MHDYTRKTLFIDGRWVTPAEDGAIEVVDPATEQVIGSVPNGDAADVDAAVAAARRAFDPLITVAERRDRLHRVITAMEKRLPDIAETITREMGAPVRIAQGCRPRCRWRWRGGSPMCSTPSISKSAWATR